MSLADAFAGADARFRAQVMHATWGHLEQRRQPNWRRVLEPFQQSKKQRQIEATVSKK